LIQDTIIVRLKIGRKTSRNSLNSLFGLIDSAVLSYQCPLIAKPCHLPISAIVLVLSWVSVLAVIIDVAPNQHDKTGKEATVKVNVDLQKALEDASKRAKEAENIEVIDVDFEES
jgi:hypothetical protein